MKEIFNFHAAAKEYSAEKVINDIIEEVELLKIYPGIGQRLLSWANKEIRMILFGNYRIIYYVKEKRIDILAVFH